MFYFSSFVIIVAGSACIYIISSMPTTPSPPLSPVVPQTGGFLPDTFLKEVDQFLEDTESDLEEGEDGEDGNEGADTIQFWKEPILVNAIIPNNGATKSSPTTTTTKTATPSIATDATAKNSASPTKPSSPSVTRRSTVSSSSASSPIKSVLKKTSSYNGLEGLGDDEIGKGKKEHDDVIPINTHKSAWKALPAPKPTTGTTTTTTTTCPGVRRVESSPQLGESDESSSMKRNVSFHKIMIRDYDMTLGDNPSCVSGTPVGLDWEYQEQEPLPVDDYESSRPERRTRREMMLGWDQRQHILRGAGVSRGEMKHAAQQVNRVRRQRAATATLLHLMPLEVMVESATRKVKRLASLGKKKKHHMKQSKSANDLLSAL